ncbi:unnamed protein product, partial [Ceratitis capitata]
MWSVSLCTREIKTKKTLGISCPSMCQYYTDLTKQLELYLSIGSNLRLSMCECEETWY